MHADCNSRYHSGTFLTRAIVSPDVSRTRATLNPSKVLQIFRGWKCWVWNQGILMALVVMHVLVQSEVHTVVSHYHAAGSCLSNNSNLTTFAPPQYRDCWNGKSSRAYAVQCQKCKTKEERGNSGIVGLTILAQRYYED